MQIERIHNELTLSDSIFIQMSPDELRTLRFDLSIARVSLPHLRLDGLDAFVTETGEVV